MTQKSDMAVAIETARNALEPFAKVAAIFADRAPQHGDTIMAWEFTSGSAEIRISDCKRAAAALAALSLATDQTGGK